MWEHVQEALGKGTILNDEVAESEQRGVLFIRRVSGIRPIFGLCYTEWEVWLFLRKSPEGPFVCGVTFGDFYPLLCLPKISRIRRRDSNERRREEKGCMNDSAGKFCPDIMPPRAIVNVQKQTEDAWDEARVQAGCVAASDGCAPG